MSADREFFPTSFPSFPAIVKTRQQKEGERSLPAPGKKGERSLDMTQIGSFPLHTLSPSHTLPPTAPRYEGETDTLRQRERKNSEAQHGHRLSLAAGVIDGAYGPTWWPDSWKVAALVTAGCMSAFECSSGPATWCNTPQPPTRSVAPLPTPCPTDYHWRRRRERHDGRKTSYRDFPPWQNKATGRSAMPENGIVHRSINWSG